MCLVRFVFIAFVVYVFRPFVPCFVRSLFRYIVRYLFRSSILHLGTYVSMAFFYLGVFRVYDFKFMYFSMYVCM